MLSISWAWRRLPVKLCSSVDQSRVLKEATVSDSSIIGHFKWWYTLSSILHNSSASMRNDTLWFIWFIQDKLSNISTLLRTNVSVDTNNSLRCVTWQRNTDVDVLLPRPVWHRPAEPRRSAWQASESVERSQSVELVTVRICVEIWSWNLLCTTQI